VRNENNLIKYTRIMWAYSGVYTGTKMDAVARHQWLMPVIPAAQEAEIRRIVI
jgi:hypothetical protein